MFFVQLGCNHAKQGDLTKMAYRVAWTLACLVCLPLPALSQTAAGDFDLLVRGIKAATVHFSAHQDRSDYTVKGRVQTTGLAALIKRLRYDGAATGSVIKGRFAPTTYSESADTGRRQSDATLVYANGVPRLTAYSPAVALTPGDVDPATMGGSVDPLTALYATLRAIDAGRECNLSLDLFDGKRASKLQISAPKTVGNTVTCEGAYIRVQGFTAKEMAKQPRFPFTLTYAPAATGQMQVVEVISETIYGKVTLKRR